MAGKDNKKKMFCHSIDIPQTSLNLCFKSLSDSELETLSDMSTPKLTLEYLDLLSKLNYHTNSSRACRLDTERMCNSLVNLTISSQCKHGVRSVQKPLHSLTPNSELCKPQLAIHKVDSDNNVEHLDFSHSNQDGNEDLMQSELSHSYTENLPKYKNEDFLIQGSAMWNLEPRCHALLSPHSSNGSIFSFRSSNTDSAIEMLTPDEEFPDHLMPDTTAYSQLLLNSQQLKADETSTLWDRSNVTDGDNSNGQLTVTTKTIPIYSEKTFSTNINSSLAYLNSSYNLNITQQSYISDVTLVEQGTGRSFLQPPSVVISDFSSDVSLEEQCYQTAILDISQDLQRDSQTSYSDISQYSDKCSQSVFSNIAQDSQSNVLEDHLLYHRTLSNTSVSSNESSISVFSDSSQDLEEQPVFQQNVKSEQSPWKKIRNVVHWAPFIQQFKKRKYPWIQLAGHQGNFQAGEPGTILKKYDPLEDRAFKKLMIDVLRPYVPKFCGEQVKNGVCYLQLQDLLCEYEAPFVMDVKMGCRTYLEKELIMAREKPSLRKDMYQKMVKVDPSAPTAEENQHKALTKARYMQWRDEMSSTKEMGFRIEGIRKSDGAQVKNFKTTKERANIKRCLKQFVEENPVIINKYLRRLKAIRESQEISQFLKGHEVIGSSLLFVHDRHGEANIWMIDFGKTVPLPESVSVTHRLPWMEGSNEDGYLFGVDSLVTIFEEMNGENPVQDFLSKTESMLPLSDLVES